MSFVYQIQGDEQINALVRVVRDAPEQEVLFAVPVETRSLRNSVNLRLMRFYADQEGKRLIIVSKDVVVQKAAQEAGLRCLESLPGNDSGERETGDALIESGGGEPVLARLAKSWPRRVAQAVALRNVLRPRWQHLLLLPFLLVLLAGGTYLTAPSVTVEVTPAFEERDVAVTVPVGADDLASVRRSLPVTSEVAATGRRVVGLTPARGVATFINQGSVSVTVPAGTEVGTGEGEVFKTTRSISVPARETEYFAKVAVGLRAGRRDAPIVSVALGASGNLAAGRIRVIGGPLNKTLQVVNPEVLAGGEDRALVVATADDEERAVAALESEARLVALSEARRGVPGGSRLIEESITVNIESVVASPAVGAETKSVKASGTAAITGLALKESGVAQRAAAAARAAVPKGWLAVDEGRLVKIGFDGTAGNLGPGHAVVRLGLCRVVRQDLVVAAARGKVRAEAEAAVRNLPGVNAVRVLGGGKRLPAWSGKIRVSVRNGPL